MAFNGDTYTQEAVMLLLSSFGITKVIETGTYHGHTTAFLAEKNPDKQITTIELTNEFYDIAKQRLDGFKNIVMHKGDSPIILNNILKYMIQDKILFYLDAHWFNNFPVNSELQTIANTHKDNCCVIIDDFKVPNRNLKFDSCDQAHNPLDMNHIHDSMNILFSKPFFFFNDKHTPVSYNGKTINGCGKVYIFPEQWLDKFINAPFKKDGEYYYHVA
jgi:hypothetical protein